MKVNSIEKNVDDGKFYDLTRFCIYRVSYCKYFISYLLLFEDSSNHSYRFCLVYYTTRVVSFSSRYRLFLEME